MSYRKASDKWMAVAKGAVDNGYKDCVLCLDYFSRNEYTTDNCEDCPVRLDTGKTTCEDTPYMEWLDHQDDAHADKDEHMVYCDECQLLALNEWLYLKSIGE